MSVEAVSEFLKKAFEDETILEEVAKAVESGGDREGVAQVAAKHGYQFTTEELGSSIDEMNAAGAKLREQKTELSDSELEDVAGGAFGDVIGNIVNSNAPAGDLYFNTSQKSPTLYNMMYSMQWNKSTSSPNW